MLQGRQAKSTVNLKSRSFEHKQQVRENLTAAVRLTGTHKNGEANASWTVRCSTAEHQAHPRETCELSQPIKLRNPLKRQGKTQCMRDDDLSVIRHHAPALSPSLHRASSI
jgi:invasion protein IalB